MSIYLKIKKYILILSIFFSLVVFSHLIYLYLYNWSKTVAKQWWTISIGFIWNTPSLNPLDFWVDSNNDYVLQFLYRSLIRYNISTKKMEGDLANCDLWRNFSTIKCYIKSWLVWNDGSPITKDDVFATYDYLKNSWNSNPMKDLLNNIDFTDKWDYIEFRAKNADVLLLDAFVIPIVKKEQVNALRSSSWSLNLKFVTNWAYTVFNKWFDSEYNSANITLEKSSLENSKGSYIWKVVFKFFQDKNTLLKNENSLNIIFPTDDTELLISPRFNKYNFLFPQYVWLFLNTEKLSNNDLRKSILFQLENASYPELDDKKWKKIFNPYLWNERITPELTNKNFSSILASLGFYNKDVLISEINKKYDETSKSKTWALAPDTNIYIKTPSNLKNFFYNGNPEILISWNVPALVGWVYINDFKLKSFIPGNTKFYFRANADFKTLVEWQNSYTLYFDINGKKVKKETLNVYYYKDGAALEAKKTEVNQNLSKVKPLTQTDLKKMDGDKKADIAKVQDLDSLYYYDKNFNRFSINLDYVNEWSYSTYLAKRIQEELKFLWIDVKSKEINQKDMQQIVKWDKNYDMLLVWVNHGLYDYNIFPFFHSWQAKVGFNFSKIKNVSLDMLLEKEKSGQLENDKLEQIKKESFDIFKKEAIVKTFYSPYSFFYVDKNIKNIQNVELLPYRYYSYDIIKNWYIKEDRIIDFGTKTIQGFLNWIKSIY